MEVIPAFTKAIFILSIENYKHPLVVCLTGRLDSLKHVPVTVLVSALGQLYIHDTDERKKKNRITEMCFFVPQSVFKPCYALCNVLWSHPRVAWPLLFMPTIDGASLRAERVEWEGYLSLVSVLSDVPEDKRRGDRVFSALSLEGAKPIWKYSFQGDSVSNKTTTHISNSLYTKAQLCCGVMRYKCEQSKVITMLSVTSH